MDTDTIDSTATNVPLEGPAEADKPEFAFVVVKSQQGTLQVNNLPSAQVIREPQLDDIYSAIKIIERDIVAKQTATTVLQTMTEVAKQQQSGLVVPTPNSKFKKVARV